MSLRSLMRAIPSQATTLQYDAHDTTTKRSSSTSPSTEVRVRPVIEVRPSAEKR